MKFDPHSVARDPAQKLLDYLEQTPVVRLPSIAEALHEDLVTTLRILQDLLERGLVECLSPVGTDVGELIREGKEDRIFYCRQNVEHRNSILFQQYPQDSPRAFVSLRATAVLLFESQRV